MIEVSGVYRTFTLGDSEVHALNNVSLDIEQGDYISVMGPSGSGKSTLLNMLGLLDRPDRGRYLLNGVDTQALDENERARLRREEIGFVFQSYHLINRLTARENIEMPLMLTGVPPRRRHEMVQDILERLGIARRAQHLPNQLSGGERQRVAIGRSIVMKPTILLADEPTGNLDTKSGAEVTQILEDLNREGITLLVVTHDAEKGERARRRILMRDGRVAADERDEQVA
ncbi:MAG: macrolide ABC transporter ATP-binding protein [Halioglobus sp.]|nr:macrolide ABC transporter ATP-binding protein [Halioglobus sp.]|tara:strand:+ start:522 stop:1208 length:687 start_codon:yes stop_codon:yes gene_type:complete